MDFRKSDLPASATAGAASTSGGPSSSGVILGERRRHAGFCQADLVTGGGELLLDNEAGLSDPSEESSAELQSVSTPSSFRAEARVRSKAQSVLCNGCALLLE